MCMSGILVLSIALSTAIYSMIQIHSQKFGELIMFLMMRVAPQIGAIASPHPEYIRKYIDMLHFENFMHVCPL